MNPTELIRTSQSPVITIEEEGKPKVTVAESGAITEVLLERYGGGKLFVPPTADLQKRADFLYWLHFAEVCLSALNPTSEEELTFADSKRYRAAPCCL